MRIKKNNFIFCLSFLAYFPSSFGQILQLEDLLKMHSLDSISLKQSCSEKKFNLEYIDEDDWAFVYSFRSNDDKKVSLSRVFPKGTSASESLIFEFNMKKEYKNFRDSIKSRGYIFSDRFVSSAKDYRRRSTLYVNDKSGLEIELGTQNSKESKYTIAVIRRISD